VGVGEGRVTARFGPADICFGELLNRHTGLLVVHGQRRTGQLSVNGRQRPCKSHSRSGELRCSSLCITPFLRALRWAQPETLSARWLRKRQCNVQCGTMYLHGPIVGFQQWTVREAR
jgi:hypothetical protein